MWQVSLVPDASVPCPVVLSFSSACRFHLNCPPFRQAMFSTIAFVFCGFMTVVAFRIQVPRLGVSVRVGRSYHQSLPTLPQFQRTESASPPTWNLRSMQRLRLLSSWSPRTVSEVASPLEAFVENAAKIYNSTCSSLSKISNDRESKILARTSHVVVQNLPFQERSSTNAAIVESFKKRANVRKAADDCSWNKRENPRMVLLAGSGCGKSSVMVHFPYSKEYANFCEEVSNVPREGLEPLVSVFTFNSLMPLVDGEIVSGLRLIFGLLKSTGLDLAWEEFYGKWRDDAFASKLDCRDAVKLLRKYFGRRRLFIGVDDIWKAGSVSVQVSLMSELDYAIARDDDLDVLVASLSPDHIENMLRSLGDRWCQFIPLAPLLGGEMDEQFEGPCRQFAQQCEDAITTQEEANNITSSSSDVTLRKAIFENVHLLASGHPGTLDKLLQDLKSGVLLSSIRSRLYDVRSNAFQIIKLLSSHMPQVLGHPETPEQCDIILSTKKLSDGRQSNRVSRMLENGRCYAWSDDCMFGEKSFGVGTTIPALLAMIYKIAVSPVIHSTPLCNAATALFNESDLINSNISVLWERCNAMVTVAQHHDAPFCDGVFPDLYLHAKRCPRMNVIVPRNVGDMKYSPNTLYVAPPHNPGFDMLTCLVGYKPPREFYDPDLDDEDEEDEVEWAPELFVYQEVKVLKPRELQLEVEGQIGLVNLIANKLALTLQHHADVQLHKPMAAVTTDDLKGVFFMISLFGIELEDVGLDWRSLQHQLIEILEKWINTATFETSHYRLAKLFLEKMHFPSHFAFQGTERVTATMQPTLVPFAKLIQKLDDDNIPDLFFKPMPVPSLSDEEWKRRSGRQSSFGEWLSGWTNTWTAGLRRRLSSWAGRLAPQSRHC